MVFQGEEGNKTYPLRNKGQRDWYSEIEKEESSRRSQNRGRPGEGREVGGRGSREENRGHLWQSRVEIEHYSIAYFDHITVFEVL